MSEEPRPGERKYWIDDLRNVNKIFWSLAAVCVLLVIGYVIYVESNKADVREHVHYSWETWFGFYGIYGFVCCVALVLAARLLRVFLKRDEDYYDR